MKFGLYLRSFMSDPSRELYQQIEDAVEVCHIARDVGFSAISVPQHWVGYPTVWPQPLPILARMAPETGDMRLLTGVLLLPLHNPVDIAESAVTLDHISNGRFILGVGLGYRETELEAVGITRKDRVPRLTEGIELMKRLWSGEAVDFEGRYFRVHDARLGVTPVQQPHPPIWIACQSPAAARRAGRIADACYLAPQVGFNDLKALVGEYLEESQSREGSERRTVALSRAVSVAGTREDAVREARDKAEGSYKMYSSWEMQEATMVKIHISSDSEIADWAVAGNTEECFDQFVSLRDDVGVDSVVLNFLNLPEDLSGRKEYLQNFSENVIQRMN